MKELVRIIAMYDWLNVFNWIFNYTDFSQHKNS